MPKHVMSDALKYELAKEIGVYETVMSDGWSAVSSRDCGRLVPAAIAYANKMAEMNGIK